MPERVGQAFEQTRSSEDVPMDWLLTVQGQCRQRPKEPDEQSETNHVGFGFAFANIYSISYWERIRKLL